MLSRRLMTTGVLVALLAVVPAAQAGDLVITPFAGVVFGGDTDQTHGTYGFGLGYMGDHALGFELDFAYSPDFFGGDDTLVPDNNLTSLMGNLVLSAPLGESRVYLSAGAGLLKSRVDDARDFFDVDRNDFGVNAGAGLLLSLGDRVGLRGDIRYFRNVGDPEPDREFDIDFGSFDFWRATGGLAIKF